jgi:hypothetical protein
VRSPLFFALCAILLSGTACGQGGADPEAGSTISRESFVEAYLLLRLEDLRYPGMDLSIQARDSVLNEVGVTEEELLAFVDEWGRDAEVMQSIWQELDSLMREDRRGRMGDPSNEDFEEEPENIGRGRGGRP